MKKSCLLLMVLMCAGVARAQGTGTSIPSGKIAVIYSEAFQDPTNGIAKFAASITKLNAEFKPIQDELTQTAARLRTMQDEINKMQQGNPAATPQQIQAKIDQFDDQKKAYDRKGEDAKANYAKRRGDLLAPLQVEIGKALDGFGKAHGIMMILDGSQLPLVYTADGVDVTRAFIAEYNSKNPATTTAATPRPQLQHCKMDSCPRLHDSRNMETVLDSEAIKKLLPHRSPFLLVDRIIELIPRERVVGIKQVSINESYFQGHFPGAPVMPGVLVIEAMAQCGAILALREIQDRDQKLVLFTGIKEARFRRPVVPGDTLVLEVTALRTASPIARKWGEPKR